MNQTQTIDDVALNEKNRTKIVIGVMFGVTLAGLDATVVGTAMPTIISVLGGMALYTWVFSAYMLTTAISMPLWGKLSDVYGKKPLFQIAVLFFLIGSILSGASQNMVQLIIFRGVQGIGAGGLAAVSYALIGTIFPPAKRGRGAGALSATWGISSLLGPLTGSFIVTHFDWQWVFFINIPVGILSIIIIHINFKEITQAKRERIDYAGAAIFIASVFSLLMAFLLFGKGSAFFSFNVTGLIMVSVIFIFAFITNEGKFGDPIIRIDYYRDRAFGVGNLLAFLAGFAMYGIISFVPLFVQSIQGGSPLTAGLAIMPMALAWSAASFSAGRLIQKYGEKLFIRLGLVLMATGFLAATFVHYDSSMYFVIIFVSFIGAGMGFNTPAILVTVQNSMNKNVIGVATSSQMLARTLGGTMGVSIMGTTLARSMLVEFSELSKTGKLNSLPEVVQNHFGEPHELLSSHLRGLMQQQDLVTVLSVFTNSLQNVFFVALTIVILGFIVSWLLPKSKV
ncbi:MAG: MDR family MFS transporter [Bacteroidota bacterium]|nr:MDR family MFS transporter [Bacteroidota bacterium]